MEAGAQAQPHGSILPLRNPKPSANAAAGLGLALGPDKLARSGGRDLG